MDETVAASSDPPSAFKWLMELQAAGKTFDDFATYIGPDGSNFVTLDAKLASAITRIANQEFGKMVQTKKLGEIALLGRDCFA